jgi:hypothetical protein
MSKKPKVTMVPMEELDEELAEMAGDSPAMAETVQLSPDDIVVKANKPAPTPVSRPDISGVDLLGVLLVPERIETGLIDLLSILTGQKDINLDSLCKQYHLTVAQRERLLNVFRSDRRYRIGAGSPTKAIRK